jgi:hypothetical protein
MNLLSIPLKMSCVSRRKDKYLILIVGLSSCYVIPISELFKTLKISIFLYHALIPGNMIAEVHSHGVASDTGIPYCAFLFSCEAACHQSSFGMRKILRH